MTGGVLGMTGGEILRIAQDDRSFASLRMTSGALGMTGGEILRFAQDDKCFAQDDKRCAQDDRRCGQDGAVILSAVKDLNQ
jgi:hypothetical protein